MLKIGTFSKMSHITVKALRFYEKAGILKPASIDEWTGYRYYETEQLYLAARIKSYRQLGLSLEEIRELLSGGDAGRILREKAAALYAEKADIENRLSAISIVLEEKEMKYQVTEKMIPEMTVYTAEAVLPHISDIMTWIPSLGEECLRLNPGLRCPDVPYEFCEYPDGAFRETDVRVRHSEAVIGMGKENDIIRFRTLPAARVLGVYHKGSYDRIGEAYAFLLKYAETNGFHAVGLPRECYIDGIWNKESPADWLTEIELPIG